MVLVTVLKFRKHFIIVTEIIHKKHNLPLKTITSWNGFRLPTTEGTSAAIGLCLGCKLEPYPLWWAHANHFMVCFATSVTSPTYCTILIITVVWPGIHHTWNKIINFFAIFKFITSFSNIIKLHCLMYLEWDLENMDHIEVVNLLLSCCHEVLGSIPWNYFVTNTISHYR